ncbi:MAG: hypothetical protein IJH43_05675 [Mogibacterium sp.]|nr:hypothetical protein [Mogibacterium sp.]
MNSKDYAMGLAFGIVTALIIFALIWKFSKKGLKGTFDERQELVRGRGYKYATFTMLILLAIELLIESFDLFETLPITRTLTLFFIILAGVLVYAFYCIKNDAYFGVGTDARTYRIVMWAVIIVNAISGIIGLKNGAMVDGKLAFGPVASLLFVAAFIMILVAMSIRNNSHAGEEESDEE